MAMFLAHIAAILEVIASASGLIVLHYALQSRAKLIKWAAILLIIFGFGSLGCTWYYAAKYFLMGHYDHAYGFNMTIEGNGPHYHCGSIGD